MTLPPLNCLAEWNEVDWFVLCLGKISNNHDNLIYLCMPSHTLYSPPPPPVYQKIPCPSGIIGIYLQSPEHKLDPNHMINPCSCCVVSSVTCMTARVFLFYCSVLMYIGNTFMYRFCTGCPPFLFSALVNKKRQSLYYERTSVGWSFSHVTNIL